MHGTHDLLLRFFFISTILMVEYVIFLIARDFNARVGNDNTNRERIIGKDWLGESPRLKEKYNTQYKDKQVKKSTRRDKRMYAE